MGADHLLALADFHVGVDFVKVPHQSQRNREQPHLGRSWALWITTASNAPLKSPRSRLISTWVGSDSGQPPTPFIPFGNLIPNFLAKSNSSRAVECCTRCTLHHTSLSYHRSKTPLTSVEDIWCSEAEFARFCIIPSQETIISHGYSTPPDFPY